MPKQETLDITKVKTVEDLNSVDFNKYADKRFSEWVRHINYPVKQKDLYRVCDLSTKTGSKVILGWSMGELFYKVRILPSIKPLKQMLLFNDEIFGPPGKVKVIPIM